MKTKNRLSKALAVILIVGAGVMYNMDYPQYINTQNTLISEQITNTTEEAAKSDSTIATAALAPSANLNWLIKTVFQQSETPRTARRCWMALLSL